MDERRIISGIIFVIRNGLRRRLTARQDDFKPVHPLEPDGGVFNRIIAGLAAEGGAPDHLMIDVTHLKVHRTAASLLKKGLFP